VTATDTSALAGSSQTACLRKYWAKPMRNEMMHEIGIRILIRKVQLIGMDNEKALTPIFSYFKDHYYRIFFRCEKGRQKADMIGKMHRYFLYDKETLDMEVSEFNKKEGFEYAGPLWCGNLWDQELAEKMFELADKDNKKLTDMLSFIKDESNIDSVGFYDLNRLAKIRKVQIPRIDSIISRGKIERTHFLGWGVKSKEKPF
jgi:tRNA (guanine26-N2/guanine27-N2)-dimethyltransferase